MDITSSLGCSELSVEATVIRCTCTGAQRAEPDWHGLRGDPCPHGSVRDLGRIAFWHRSRLRRWAWRIGQLLRGRRPGAITQ